MLNVEILKCDKYQLWAQIWEDSRAAKYFLQIFSFQENAGRGGNLKSASLSVSWKCQIGLLPSGTTHKYSTHTHLFETQNEWYTTCPKAAADVYVFVLNFVCVCGFHRMYVCMSERGLLLADISPISQRWDYIPCRGFSLSLSLSLSVCQIWVTFSGWEISASLDVTPSNTHQHRTPSKLSCKLFHEISSFGQCIYFYFLLAKSHHRWCSRGCASRWLLLPEHIKFFICGGRRQFGAINRG